MNNHIKDIRERGFELLKEIQMDIGKNNFREVAKEINTSINQIRDHSISIARQKAANNADLIDELLKINYASNVAMIDIRNAVWEYEYMAFSRRIGELWEQFVKIPFEQSSSLELTKPPLFSDVRKSLKKEISDYINKLGISSEEKTELVRYYEKVWKLVDSGDVSLTLDMHFAKSANIYNIDFKSGFGSNEKGNVNRLLMVATIFKELSENNRCLLIVRSPEDKNNNYFKTLKNSGVWEAHCGEDAYDKIGELTEFNIKKWMKDNINWKNDLLPETYDHLQSTKLDEYLAW